jgi:exopolysaccharide biosynthesis polyprenyl glycosylphosphotransferase
VIAAAPDTGYVERHRRRRVVVSILLFTDTLALLSATLLAEFIRFGMLTAEVGIDQISGVLSYFQVSFLVTGLWLVALWLGRLYDLERLTWGSGEFASVIRSLAIGVIAFIVFTYVIKTPGLSRAWTLLAFSLAVVFVSLGRLVVRIGLQAARKRGTFLRRTLLVGCNAEGCDILRLLTRHQESGLAVCGLLVSTGDDATDLLVVNGPIPVWGTARDVRTVACEHQIDTVIIASTAFSHEVVSKIVNDLRGMDVSIQISSGLFEILTSRIMVREVAGIPLITVRSVSFSPSQHLTKRIFDIVVASAILLVGLPLWVVLVLAIKLDSRGPVLYRQTRIGQDGFPFGMYKFRSMCVDADARLEALKASNEATGPLFKMKNDPRVTRVGKWMRKFSIDEFPQLLNVMAGKMSLVGPRPPLPAETEAYTDHSWRRMEVPPGMTGLWQVSGRSSLTFDEMVRLDLFYIENWSVGFDMGLMIRTVPAVLFGSGAY